VIAPCTTQIPVQSIPAQVTVVRGGSQLSSPPSSLQVGDEIRVPSPRYFTFSYAGNTYTLWNGDVSLQCRAVLLRSGRARPSVLAVTLQFGRMRVVSAAHPRRALVISPELLAFATRPRTTFFVQRYQSARRTKAWTKNRPIVAAKAGDQTVRINTRITYTAISDSRGLRLDIWPFPVSPLQRRTTRADGLPAYWADGQPCSVGCTTAVGWPLAPFHRQHAIRAGINELRPANFHVAVDIEAHNFQNVYAIQSGVASIRYPGTGDVNVDGQQRPVRDGIQDGDRPGAVRLLPRGLVGGLHRPIPEPASTRRQPPAVHQHRAADHRRAADLLGREGDRRGLRPAERRGDRLSVRDAGVGSVLARLAALRRPRPRLDWPSVGDARFAELPALSEAGDFRAGRRQSGV
jgi:hypothetical protein